MSISNTNKNLVVGWLTEDNIPFKDKSSDADQNVFEWLLHVDNLNTAIYTMKKFPDRIYIQHDVRLSDKHRELVNKKWEKPKLTSLLLGLTTNLTTFNTRYQILLVNQEFIGVRIYALQIDLNKNDFLNEYLRITEIFNVVLNQLSASLGIEVQKLQQEQKTGEVNPLAG